MATIVTRETGDTAKGSPLTNTEVDNNFINLNSDKMEKTQNLSDVSNAATARTNLDVPSTTESLNNAVAMAIALGVRNGIQIKSNAEPWHIWKSIDVD